MQHSWIALTVTPRSNLKDMRVIDQSKVSVWNVDWNEPIQVHDWGMLMYKEVPAHKVNISNYYVVYEGVEYAVLHFLSGPTELTGPEGSYTKETRHHLKLDPKPEVIGALVNA